MTGRFNARARGILLLPFDLYAALMIAYLVMRPLITHIYIWPIEVVGAYLHFLLLPAVPLLALSLLLKRRHTALLLCVGAIAYLILYGELFLPGPTGSQPPSQLTVMTFNTGNGTASWSALARTIRDSGADIIAIQESVTEEVSLYRREMEDLYPHQIFYGSGMGGIGLLSRYPIQDEGIKYLSSSRPYLVAALIVEDRMLTIINGHPPVMFGPGAGEDGGRDDFAMLADLAIELQPAVILGDLNVSDQNEGYSAMMSRNLTDAHRAVGTGLGLTYPRRRHYRLSIPTIRIDYILTTSEIQPIETWVGDDGGSDHMPVLAALGWGEQD